MMDNIEAKVKELVTDFKLEEALDVLIAQAQTQTQRKQNALLVLKGKLAMLEEQNLNGMLDSSDLARQRATIAHQILDIADGSPLDYELPETAPAPPPLIQKNINLPAGSGSSIGKYLLIGGLLLAVVIAGFFFVKNSGSQPEETEQTQQTPTTDQANTAGPVSEEKQTEPAQPRQQTSDEIKVLDFPNYRKKFNFSDLQYTFQEVWAEAYSDTETKLTIQFQLHCRSNLGTCYRAIPVVYVDERRIGTSYQLTTSSWIAQDSTITDEIQFVLPNNAKSYLFELSKDGSSWKRAFKFLQ
ncbi:MAG: hypothetical protein K9J37_16310 [Saprospiraceae bacterium]|nr:hypothetical protein [Saprospiraceae bacterium]MCF8251478.1 hypothetical protein [Saprospiraceae bacterium]MCF8280728.1 hypothetical protein [Bacteroidales bacterium]MCF8313338.1 hypothetical protein [Saprospiraceae bacterium]MCF8441842.1 hypothetical protein [Saprospiraceae bacterium]